MRCTKCKTTISISDWKCPKCGNNLLQLGAVELEESGKKDNHGRKSLVSEELHRGFTETAQSLVSSKIGASALFVNKKLQKILARHIPDEDIEQAFDTEILPAVDDLSEDEEALPLFEKVEERIRENLGENIYQHYCSDCDDVLKILRAGEFVYALSGDDPAEIDLSVKMFPFFKASEVACRIHAEDRYPEIRNNSLLAEMAEWIKASPQEIEIDRWLERNIRTFQDIVFGILKNDKRSLSGSLRTGIALYVFGRTWTIKIIRKDRHPPGNVKPFTIDNWLKVKGTDSERIDLAGRLREIQIMRNERIHENIEDDKAIVEKGRNLSYVCLRAIPEVLAWTIR